MSGFRLLRGVAVLAVLCAALLAAAAVLDRGPAHPRVLVVPSEGPTIEVHLIVPRTPAPAGLAHYAEHLAWLNAVGRTARGADRHSNAWTGPHAIGYWLSGAPGDLPELVATLARVFDPIELPRDFADQERDIILREYDRALADNPDAQAAEAMSAFLYEGNEIAVSLIGTPEEIAALDQEAARAFHAATHRPETAVLVVLGDTTERRVRRILRGLDLAAAAPAPSAEGAGAPGGALAASPGGATPARAASPASAGGAAPPVAAASVFATPAFAPAPFVLAAPGQLVLREGAAAAPRLVWRRVVALPEPQPFDLLEARSALLSDILISNLPGGLAGPLRFDAALARSFEIGLWPLDERHVELHLLAAPDAGLSLPDLAAAFETVLSEVAQAGIPEETHARVLARFETYWPDWDDPEETADWMGSYVLGRIEALRMPLGEGDLKPLGTALSAEDLTLLLRRIAGEGRTAMAFIGPEEMLR